jgi:prepilin peptidase CpaA
MHGEIMLIHFAVIMLAGAACITDLRWRRIPNSLVIAGLCLGVVLNLQAAGVRGLGRSVAGAALGLALLLPFYALGGMGAGDVKLLAALGSLLGPGDLLRASLAGALAGGLLALGLAFRRGRLLDTLRSLGRLLSTWATGGIRPSPELSLANPSTLKIPYAVPLAAGACLFVASRWS